MIKGAVLDIDGVLLDSLGVWEDLGARYLRACGMVPEAGLNDILFSMSMEQGAGYLKTHYHLTQSRAEILKSMENMLKTFYFDEVAAKTGAKELLHFLKERKIRMAAATSSPRAHVERALERNGLLPYFEKIVTTGEVGSSKHTPDIYHLAADFLNAKPGETLVFEDSLYALKTAKAAGYLSVGVYDAKGEPDQDGLRNTGDCYLEDLGAFRNEYARLIKCARERELR